MSRIVVISGGGTGIGLAVAEAFVRDGDQVVLVGRRKDVLDGAVARLGSGSALAVPADLTDEAGTAGVRELVAERFGRVDVLVNNAGGNVALGGGEPSLTELWTGNFRSNVLTAVLLTEALRDLLADGGRVLLLSSIAAVRGGGSGSYGAAKAALHPYAYDLAADLGGRGITVNVIAPGFIDDTEFFGGRMTQERRAFLVGQTLTGRVGVPEDVASLAHWLASPGAAHITAQIHQVNGGAERGR
ncbi:SDR family NAD(P)-dependent oxidoreductase [Streptomyces sp. PA03-1a]|nr:SDR family NAD(P)-dependent oxidoreductase [Streptomyces sp. PA03-1a]MDX2815410.1 SDR family NAD(P)-dependent oxidoreductase [Streptomyces sp. PA03-5A]